MVIDLLAGLLAAVAPDIADGQHLDILAPRIAARHIGPGAAQQVAAPLAAHADEPHRHPLAGRHGAGSAQSRGRDNGRRGERSGEGGGGLAQESRRLTGDAAVHNLLCATVRTEGYPFAGRMSSARVLERWSIAAVHWDCNSTGLDYPGRWLRVRAGTTGRSTLCQSRN